MITTRFAQLLWFLASVWSGSAFAMWYFLHKLNDAWHMYDGQAWYNKFKLLYMVPWTVMTSTPICIGVFAGSVAVGLIIGGIVGGMYHRRKRREIRETREFLTSLSDGRLQMLMSQQQGVDWTGVIQTGGQFALEALSKKDLKQITKAAQRAIGSGH